MKAPFLIAILSCATAYGADSASALPESPGFKPVVGYYWSRPIETLLTNATVTDFICSNLTHLVVRPQPTINGDGSLSMTAADRGLLSNVVNTLHTRGVKVLVEGLITAPGVSWSNIVRSASARATYARNIVRFCQDNGVDGLDYDWEYPTRADLPYFTLVLRDVRAVAPPGFQISLATAIWFASVETNAVPYVDFIMPMTYRDEPPQYTMDQVAGVMNAWVGWGFPKSKLLMGLPFYGPKARGMTWGYGHIIGTNNVDPALDNYNGWSYNGINTIQQKTRWVYANGFAGTMIFDVALDAYDSRSLLLALARQARDCALTNGASSLAPKTPTRNATVRMTSEK